MLTHRGNHSTQRHDSDSDCPALSHRNGQNRYLLLNLSILNGPGEVGVYSQEVIGSKRVTYNALLREGRSRTSDHI